MPSLIRRPNESITLHTSDGLVKITLSQIKGNQARIGIGAPRSITIVRTEIDVAPPRKSLKVTGF